MESTGEFSAGWRCATLSQVTPGPGRPIDPFLPRLPETCRMTDCKRVKSGALDGDFHVIAPRTKIASFVPKTRASVRIMYFLLYEFPFVVSFCTHSTHLGGVTRLRREIRVSLGEVFLAHLREYLVLSLQGVEGVPSEEVGEHESGPLVFHEKCKAVGKTIQRSSGA